MSHNTVAKFLVKLFTTRRRAIPRELGLILANSHRFLLQSSAIERTSVIKEGSISIDTGFLPSTPIALRMPSSHQEWDEIAHHIPSLLASYHLVEMIQRLPILDADFPDAYLDRASMIISALAHAYCFQEKKPMLPPQLEKPWQQITRRLGRAKIMRTAADDFLHNWRFKRTDIPELMQIDNLDTLVPYFFEQEDRLMNLTVTLTEHAFAPALKHIVTAQTAVLEQNDDALLNAIGEISYILRKVAAVFSFISPNSYSAYYVDPVIWAKTFATIGTSTREGELGNSGVSLPLFHVLDAFMGRESFDSELGSQMKERAKDLPAEHQAFMETLQEISIREYIRSSKNSRLKAAFDHLLAMYSGKNGLLNVHRQKAFGYMKLAIQSGRTETNNSGVGENSSTKTSLAPWEAINLSLQEGSAERLSLHCGGKYYPVHAKDIEKLSDTVYRITLKPLDTVETWQPGDKIELLPENSIVDQAYMRQYLDRGITSVVLNEEWKIWFQNSLGRSIESVALGEFLTYVDLHHINASALFDFLGISRDLHPTHLLNFRELVSFVESEKPRFDFAALLLDIQSPHYLAKWLLPLRPRLYSVTEIKKEEEYITLTINHAVSLIKAEDKPRCPFSGKLSAESAAKRCPFSGKVASSYLSLWKNEPRVTHMPSYQFKLPTRSHATVIMFAAGTGIAPFISFIENAPSSIQLVLYYSVSTMKDFLYQRQLISLAKQRKIALKVIFTRENRAVTYTPQDEIHYAFEQGGHIEQFLQTPEQQEELKQNILLTHAYLYICGSSGFYTTVSQCLKELVSGEYLSRLAAEQRYVPEVYDTTMRVSATEVFSAADVAKHNQINDCWVIINHHVYDLSEYMHLHPGGIKIVMSCAGLDGTRDFSAVHGGEQGIEGHLNMYCIGQVELLHLTEPFTSMYEKKLTQLLSITNLQNKFFNNFFFGDRKITFRLLEASLSKFFIDEIKTAEHDLTTTREDTTTVQELLIQAIHTLKSQLIEGAPEAEENARVFINHLWQLSKTFLGELQSIYHTFLKCIENNESPAELLEAKTYALDEQASTLFQQYWELLSEALQSQIVLPAAESTQSVLATAI